MAPRRILVDRERSAPLRESDSRPGEVLGYHRREEREMKRLILGAVCAAAALVPSAKAEARTDYKDYDCGTHTADECLSVCKFITSTFEENVAYNVVFDEAGKPSCRIYF
jgi:hypothetical protein